MGNDIKIVLSTEIKNAAKNLSVFGKSLKTVGKSGTQGFGAIFSAIKKTNGAMVNLNKDANRTNTTIKSLSGSFGLLGKFMGAVPLFLFANFLKNATMMSVSAIETQNLFSVALGESAKEVDAFATELSDKIGMNKTTLQEAMGTYGLLAKSMGIASEQSKLLAQNTTILAIDLASLTNVPIEQVMADLRSGLVGQTETVYKYGVDLTEASLQQEAYRLGIEQSVRTMDQGTKMMLRSSLMTQVLTKDLGDGKAVLGDFARTMNQPANLLKILSEKVKTLSIALGNAFLPVLAKVLPYMIAFVEILIDAANALATFLGYNEEDFGTPFSDGLSLDPVKDGADDATDAVDGTAKAVKNLKKTLLGIDELNIMQAPKEDSDVSGGGGGLGSGLDLKDQIKLPDLSTFYDDITNASKELKDKMLPTVQTIAAVIGTIAAIFAGAKIAGAVNTVSTAFMGLSTFARLALLAIGGIALIIAGAALAVAGFIKIITEATPSFEGFFMALGGILLVAAGIAIIFGGIPALIAILIGVVAMAVVYLIKYWDEISSAFMTGWNAVGEIFSLGAETIIKGIVDFWNWLVQMNIDSWTTIGEGISDFFNGAGYIFVLGCNTIGATVTNFITGIKDKFVLGWNSVTSGITSFINNIGTKFQLGWNAVVSGVTGFFSSIILKFQLGWNTVTNGIKAFIEGVIKLFTDLPANIKTAIENQIQTIKNIGKYIIDGIVKGFGDIAKKASELANSFVSGFKTALGIKSPSKVMQNEVGKYMGLGISKGMIDAESDIVSSATTLADSVQGAFDGVTGVDTASLVPTDLGQFDVGTAVMRQQVSNETIGTSGAAVSGIIEEMSGIISNKNADNNGDNVTNLYIDGVYSGTVRNMDRKNTRAGKTVFTVGG